LVVQNDQPSSAAVSAPILFVAPVGLPRNALIEWQVAFHTGESKAGAAGQDDASSDDDDSRPAALASATTPARFTAGAAAGGRIKWQATAFDGAQWGVAGVKDLGALASTHLIGQGPSLFQTSH
jgi:hypothetical protein